MNFRVIALIVAVPFLSYPAQAQDRQAVASPANVSKVFPASPAKVPLTKVSQTKASQAQAEQVEVSETQAPSFRKGLWRFVRTLDIVRNTNKNIKYRLANNEVTRCVDPTHSMKATFSSAPVGSCVSDKPEKVGNKYTFAKRCDYLGAVSTVITVHDEILTPNLMNSTAVRIRRLTWSPRRELVIAATKKRTSRQGLPYRPSSTS